VHPIDLSEHQSLVVPDGAYSRSCISCLLGLMVGNWAIRLRNKRAILVHENTKKSPIQFFIPRPLDFPKLILRLNILLKKLLNLNIKKIYIVYLLRFITFVHSAKIATYFSGE
jgi:hypothetical protein